LGGTQARLGTTREHEKDPMPRLPLHALIWSRDQSLYELYTQGQLEQRFRPGDEAAWLAWLGEVSSLAFQGISEQIGEQTAMTGYLHSFLAYPFYARNRLEEASGSLQQALRIAQSWQQADLLIEGNLTLAQVELARGDLATADQALHQAEALSQQERLATVAFGVEAARVQYWLAAGDLEDRNNPNRAGGICITTFV
jgi:ATP/maltotriose-dependent transcriptional regulator MalT